MEEFIDKSFVYAVVGASRNPDKYGYKVVDDLAGAGFKVVPVNPSGGMIGALDVVASLNDIEDGVDVVVFVTPPKVTRQVLEDVIALGIQKVWCQPGACDDEVVAFCEEAGLSLVHDTCIMLSHKN